MYSNNDRGTSLFNILERILNIKNEIIDDVLFKISKYVSEDAMYLLNQNVLEHDSLSKKINKSMKEQDLLDINREDMLNRKLALENSIKEKISQLQIRYPFEKNNSILNNDAVIEFEQLKEKLEYGLFEGNIYYRGESKTYSSSLVPKIYRYGIYNEKKYFLTAQTHYPNEFNSMKNLESLSKMQHYGFPTRLLDLTGNPLVALYFACCENTDEDGYLFIFYPDKTLSFDSDRATMLAALSRLSSKQYSGVKDYVLNNRIKKAQLYKPIIKSNISRNENMENYVYEIAKEKPAFLNKHRMIPFDIYNSFYVVPQMTNTRVIAQNGLFLINGIDEDNIKDSKLYSKITISSVDKIQILKDLDKLKINKATLFPELSNGAEYYTNMV